MIDPFNQWIVVPDDRPTLPSVDDEVNGLKDITSLRNPSDLYTNEQYLGRNRGLLLDQDIFSSEYEDPDAFEPIAEPDLSTDTCPSQILAPRDVDVFQCPMSHYYLSNMLPPPALSPDSSPASAASSTPWLRTPENDMSLAEINNFSPEHMFNYGVPEIGGDELCSSLSLLDQCGHSLEDVPTQVQEFMQEDLACTSRMPSEPRRSSGVSLPPIHIGPPMPTPLRPSTLKARSSTPHQIPSTPSSILTSPVLVVTPPQTQVVPLELTCRTTSLPHTTPHPSQYLLSSSPMMHPAASSPQLRLSPLSPLTILSRSPSPSPLSTPPICLPSPSPALSCISLSEIEYRNEDVVEADPGTPYNTASPIIEQSTMSSAKQLGKRRRVDSLDAPPPKISKRSKVAKVDEAEYRPSTSRPNRVNATSHSKPSPHPKAGPSRQGGSCTKNSRSEDNNTTYCKTCKKSFTRPSDYERHIRTSRKHSKKLWPCRYCGRVLARADAQSRHINSIHPGLPDPKDPPVEGDGLIPEPEDD
ncbi:hypothetical protein BDN67DRAFT_1068445 [Paxillus ammoniavirescens]|nr:hypothetical protein BDN67DRAFT_1068445 [Paxillus ammoniavirescens]